MSAPFEIREYGDPVLRTRCREITNIDAAIAKLSADMIDTMYSARGVGLAAPQIGVRSRIFVYDEGNGPKTMINPVIEESSGTWEFEEGCLSVPKMYFTFVRPKSITFSGFDLDGNQHAFKATDYLARVLQHETDHLDGKLLLDRITSDDRKQALRTLRLREVH